LNFHTFALTFTRTHYVEVSCLRPATGPAESPTHKYLGYYLLCSRLFFFFVFFFFTYFSLTQAPQIIPYFTFTTLKLHLTSAANNSSLHFTFTSPHFTFTSLSLHLTSVSFPLAARCSDPIKGHLPTWTGPQKLGPNWHEVRLIH
jgi:hypothetical protein